MIENPDSGDNKDIVIPDDSAESDAEHKAKMAELFGDLEDDGVEETAEQIKEERDNLRKTLSSMGGKLIGLQQAQKDLAEQLAGQKQESAQAIARIQKQAEDNKPFALEKFVKEVLPVIDNLELSLGAISPEQRQADVKFDKLAQGVEKTLLQLTGVFNKFGIKEINPKGEEFDPAKHEAISMQDDADAESDTVVSVAQKGYELNGRVIRHAKVIVKP